MLSNNLKIRAVILAFVVLLSGLILLFDQGDIDTQNDFIGKNITMNSQDSFKHETNIIKR